MADHPLDRLMKAIEERAWLDRPGHVLEHALAFGQNLLGLSRGRARAFLHGVPLGHPLHPMLTDVPIGSWTTAMVFDVLGMAVSGATGPARRARVCYERAARHAIGCGLAGAVAAAVTGLHDWQYTHDNARRVGLVHGALNAVALGLYGWSWWQRSNGRHGRGRFAALLGYPVIALSGYLGGGLTFRHRIGSDHSDRRLEPRRFTSVLAESELPENTPRQVRAGDVDIVLIRSNGRIHALSDLCPHLGGPLSQGWLRDGALVCPWHGSAFDLTDGASVNGPSTAPVPCFQTRVRNGRIEVRRTPEVVTAPPGSALVHQQEMTP